MICRTPEEAFQAGLNSPCEHGVPKPPDCPKCRLTPEETTRLALLLGPVMRAMAAATEQGQGEQPAA